MKLFATFIALAAACPNACSGNGICGAQSKCSCYQNWQGADCSLRSCPFTLAWADTADGTNQAHYYAECGNKGTCDRKTAECKCFDGYEGKGCRRSTCPEGCSGHGTCEYIEELAGDFLDRRNGPGNKYQDLTCNSQLDSDPATGAGNNCGTAGLYDTNVVAREANSDKFNGHQYQLWDAGKIQGCKCDLGYNGADCANREVPRGDDPLTTVKAEAQKQYIQIDGLAAGEQFFMRYYDPYGGEWTTNTITAAGAGTVAEDALTAALMQDELRALPNEVLEGVTVKGATATGNKICGCHRFYDGVQHISGFSQTTDGNFKNSKGTTNYCENSACYYGMTTGQTTSASILAASDTTGDFTIEFADKPGQTGVQYLLEVDIAAAGAGSYPVSAGGATSVTVVEINYNDNLGNLSELSDCSDRGLDNGDGECECFDGYRGLACEEQEALV
jgi:hypothetical protein